MHLSISTTMRLRNVHYSHGQARDRTEGGTQTHLNSTVLGLPYQPSLDFARWPAPPQIFPFDDFDLTKPSVTGCDPTL